MKKMILIFAFLFGLVSPAFSVKDLDLKKGATGPYYYAQITDSTNTAVNLSGATITCTMKSLTGTAKINAVACNVTSATSGYFEYRWAANDTNWCTTFLIEFTATVGGLTYIWPSKETAKVIIRDNFSY
jgi:hypothetical protein